MADDIGAEAGLTGAISKHITDRADKIKYIFIAGVVLILAAIVIFSYLRRSAAAREAQAENKMFQTLIDLENAPESDAMALFGKVADEARGLPTGARALVAKFTYAYNTGDYAGAEGAAKDFIKTYPKHYLSDRVRVGQGQALIMQGKLAEARGVLSEVVAKRQMEIYPEAKLALAQARELEAEAAKDGDAEEYKRLLEAAITEYNDIVVDSQIPNQRNLWPSYVVLPADFSLAVLKDKLAGHVHEAPVSSDAPLTDAERQAVMAIPPPAATPEGGEGDTAATEAGTVNEGAAAETVQ